MAHVRAARLLVPRLAGDGAGRSGRFVVTASAAGLLTMLGSAPYSVSKHGAVAFAEWLRATYGHRGIVVQAICPQGVRTRMLDEAGPLKELLSRDRALEPEEVADVVWQALQGDEFFVLPASRGGRLLPGPGHRSPTRGWPAWAGCRPSSTRERGHEGLAGGGRRRAGEPHCAWRTWRPSRSVPGSSACGWWRRPANFPDVLLCRGEYQVRPELPFTPGVETCGEVLAVGSDVAGLAVGDRVVGTCVLPHGSFAEEALMEAAVTFPAPAGLDDAQAAGFLIAYQTGWFALHERARLQPGETLLVHAAAGGVGTAAVQLGKAAGARVVAVVGGPDKAEVARRCGADVVVDRHTEDVVAVVKAVTGGRGADVVFDPVGGDAYTQSTKCVAFEGRIVVVGFASGTMPSPPLGHALVKNYSILGLHWGLYAQVDPARVRAAHEQLVRLVAEGAIAPVVGERVRFDGLAEGVQRLADGVTVGRVVWEA